MDEKKQQQQKGNGTTPTEARGKFETVQLRPPTQKIGSSAFSSYPGSRQHTHSPHYIHYLQQQELQKKLEEFWAKRYEEIENETAEFRTHCLPLARIKKIMKADDDVKMISAEAPVFFAKACELFIMELTMRAWMNAEVNKRRTLQKSDIASAISKTDVFDFLIDYVPKEDTMEHEVFVGIPRGEITGPIVNVPYYFMPVLPVPPHHAVGVPTYAPPPTMLMGKPLLDHRYLPAQPHHFATPVMPIPKQQTDSPSDSDDDSDE